MTRLEKKERNKHLLDEISALTEQREISIMVKDEDSIFSRYDLKPAEERELCTELEEYLVSQAEPLPRQSRIRLNIRIGKEINYGEEEIANAIQHHFAKKAEKKLIENSRILRKWIWNLAGGLVFLTVCLVLAHILNLNSEEHRFFHVLSESLGIIGWVAIWEPATYFLYGIREDIDSLWNLMRLHRAQVNVTKN